MHAAVHAPHTNPAKPRGAFPAALDGGLAGLLRAVLEPLHAQKKERGVDDMLARLYEPILWRALKVEHADVAIGHDHARSFLSCIQLNLVPNCFLCAEIDAFIG